jgi:Uma2 family endonuclease
MRATSSALVVGRNGYPTSDGKPMAETERHRNLMFELIKILEAFFALAPRVCVSGNLLIFYHQGDRRRHVSPDVFVVRGVEKRERENYLVWEERRGPQFVIEVTSSSTRHEDQRTKFNLYQDTLKVREYFLFDPFGDYLDPPLQGNRLRGGVYQAIHPREGRLASQVLGLHLEPDGPSLRLWDPRTGTWLPTPEETLERARQRAEQAEQEVDRLRREVERLRRQGGDT